MRRRRLDHFAQLGFLLCGRCLLLLGRHAVCCFFWDGAVATPSVQQNMQRELSEWSVREACMALGCIALKARQGLALHRTSIVGQRLRCCRVAELENLAYSWPGIFGGVRLF